MSGLITELKYEHSQIADTLRGVLELGINSEEGKKLLFSAKSYLLAHLEKEDTKLYPVLWKAAQNNTDLKRILDVYANDMDSISKMALEFFNKYASGGDALLFALDYKELYKELNTRIMKEETVIYKKYDEIYLYENKIFRLSPRSSSSPRD